MKTLTVRLFYALMIFISAEIVMVSCQKTRAINQDQQPEDVVIASIAGRVTDLNNVVVSNASVKAGSLTTTTDIEGRFTLQNVSMGKDAGYVQVTMPGYFNGSRTFIVNPNAVNVVEIQLIPKTVSGSFTAGVGGSVNISGGGSVEFITGNVIRASNAANYTGEVSVACFNLNPVDANFKHYMPGDLRGIDVNNQKVFLTVYGMASIEMDEGSGEKLQLASGAGNTATIHLPIPSALQSIAPASIPLWYFDEKTGFWKQEGSAVKQGDHYVGTVSHFSFWAAGSLTQSVELSARFLLDTLGVPYSNKLVTISRPDSTSTNGYTDSTGRVNGMIPANELLTMKVFNDCGENVYAKSIGPVISKTDLGTISVSNGICYTTDTSQHIQVSFNDKTYYWSSSRIWEGFGAGSHTIFVGGDPANPMDTSIGIEALIFGGVPTPGSYPVALYITINGTPTYQAGGMSYDPAYAYPTTVITKFDGIGGNIEGTISGWIKTFPSTAVADSFIVSGSYKVKRIQ